MRDIVRNILYTLTILVLTIACSSEKAIKKGDQYAAINEYFEAAKQYKRAYSNIPPKERDKRAMVAWKMAECYRLSNNPQRAAGAYMNAIRYKHPDSLAYRHLADAQIQKGEYKAAIKNYGTYLAYAPDDRMAQMGLQTAQQSMEWKKNPTRYRVKIAKELNGQRSDFCPMYVGEDTTMIIISSTRKEA